MFIGNARSGSTVSRTIIDAHPNAIISSEVNVIEKLMQGINKLELFRLILENSQHFATELQEWTGYSYYIPGQWSGKYSSLLVIGDKKAGVTCSLIHQNPGVLNELLRTVKLPLKLIHTVRNPFDNISTKILRNKKGSTFNINRYFLLEEVVFCLQKKLSDSTVFHLKHELLIEKPIEVIREVCRFLELEPYEDYLKVCSKLIYKKPHKTRFDYKWEKKHIKLVQEMMKRYPWFNGYTYEDQELTSDQ